MVLVACCRAHAVGYDVGTASSGACTAGHDVVAAGKAADAEARRRGDRRGQRPVGSDGCPGVVMEAELRGAAAQGEARRSVLHGVQRSGRTQPLGAVGLAWLQSAQHSYTRCDAAEHG